jgi:hypothetical protein
MSSPRYEPPQTTLHPMCATDMVCNAGSTALVSLGGYTYFTGMKNLRLQRKAIEMGKSKYKYGSRQLGILTISATLIGMGLYRTFN